MARSPRRCRRPRPPAGDPVFFLSTRSAAASASAFSFSASSRSSLWIRLVVAMDARPSSSSASRHCSSSAKSKPFCSRKLLSSVPESFCASPRTRIFSSIDHVFDLCRRVPISGKLRASRSHRDKVSCEIPVSRARDLALTASFPVSCSTIFCLNARENGFVTLLSLPRPAG